MTMYYKRSSKETRFYVEESRFEADKMLYSDEKFIRSWCEEEKGAEARMASTKECYNIYGFGNDCWDLHTGYWLKDLQMFDSFMKENKIRRDHLKRMICFRIERKISMVEATEGELLLRKLVIDRM